MKCRLTREMPFTIVGMILFSASITLAQPAAGPLNVQRRYCALFQSGRTVQIEFL
jgi:hypothetical protein